MWILWMFWACNGAEPVDDTECWGGPVTGGDSWWEATARADQECFTTRAYAADCVAAASIIRALDEEGSAHHYAADGRLIGYYKTNDSVERCATYGAGERFICTPVLELRSPGCAGRVPSPVSGQPCLHELPEQDWPSLDERRAEGETTCLGFAACEGPAGPVIAVVESAVQHTGPHEYAVHDATTGQKLADFTTTGASGCHGAGVWRGEPHPDCYGKTPVASAGCGVVPLGAGGGSR